MSQTPIASIVVLVGDERLRAQKCLASILSQPRINEAEILFVDCGRKAHAPLPGSDHPSVHVIPCPLPASSGQARANAVRLASAPIVAFLEEHVTVESSWLDAVIEAHAGPAAAIGAVMVCGNPGEGISDAVYVMNYANYLPGSPLREDLPMLEGHNCTYKRRCLLQFGELLPLFMLNEPLLHWRLREQGHTLQLNPSIRVIHRNETRLRDICRGYFLWNVNFGYARLFIQRWPVWKRGVYVMATPLIPFVRIVRMAQALRARQAKHLWPPFWKFLPAILAAQFAAVLGQAIGLLFGNQGADSAFLDYEINVFRGPLVD